MRGRGRALQEVEKRRRRARLVVHEEGGGRGRVLVGGMLMLADVHDMGVCLLFAWDRNVGSMVVCLFEEGL